jgi:nucleoside-diphosphate-sugar epimerase
VGTIRWVGLAAVVWCGPMKSGWRPHRTARSDETAQPLGVSSALSTVAALHASRQAVHAKAFNVGTITENYQIREIAEMVQEIVPGSKIEFAADAGPDKRCYRVDCNLIARTLHDFKPQWTARRGIEELYETYKRVGLTLDDFEGERFKRIAHVKMLVAEGQLDQDLRRLPEPAPRLTAALTR